MQLKGGDQTHIRLHNQRLILKEIIEKQEMSRSDLAKSLKISKPSISSNVDLLIKSGVLVEKGRGTSQAGRRPIMLQFNSKYGYVVGVELSKGYLLLGIADLSGNVVGIQKGKDIRNALGIDLIDVIEHGITNLLDKKGIQIENVMAIVIASPGIITGHRHIRIDPNEIYWNEVNPTHELENRLGITVIVENDVNVAALSEYANLKKYERVKNMIYISVGRGLGSGIVIDGELYKGSFGGAGEIALMIHSNSHNNRRYYESTISISSLREELRDTLLNHGLDIDSLDDEQFITSINKLLDKFPNIIDEELENFSQKLATMVSNICTILNPQIVVFGGELMVLSNHLFPKIKHKIYNTYPFPIELKLATDINYSGLSGCFVIAHDHVINRLIS